MLDRLADWLDAQPPRRRRFYSVLIAVILLTLPCYAAGVVMLALGEPAPATQATPTPEATLAPEPTRLPAAAPTLIQRESPAAPTGGVRVLPPITTLVWPTATATDEYIVITMPAIATATITSVPPTTQVPQTSPPATPTLEPPTDIPTEASDTAEPATAEPPTPEPSSEPETATSSPP